MSEHRFQINLRGIIDLLSNHLYSGPQVYIRELLQNAVDAITARRALEPGHNGEITIEVTERRPATLTFEDNGIGLTEDEIHKFVATIGQSSKRDDIAGARAEFIGQFGIGLLSCFVASDEIVMITRHVREKRAYEWRGRPDGTYAIKAAGEDISPGTRVYLRCKEGCEEYFEPDRVRELARHFGALLPHPIRVNGAAVNDEPPPWRRKFETRREEADAMADFGRAVFAADFLDWIPLRSAAGEADGVAFVLPFASLAAKRQHRVYLKNMLLSETADNLLPDWAFFVQCVVNANALRPTASRESFYEDETLEETRESLGACLRRWLADLAKRDPKRLQQFMALHHLAVKALALEDDDAFRLFADWLPFDTSTGPMTLGEIRRAGGPVRYAPTVDQFRQIARVAAAQQITILNGGYVYDADLLERLPQVFPGVEVEPIDAAELSQRFDELTLEERDAADGFLRAADAALRPYKVSVELKKFRPPELPALYSIDAEEHFHRSIEQSKEIADGNWSDMLGSLSKKEASGAEICFNWANPLVGRIARLAQRPLQTLCIQMLYVQALLLGHHPLRAAELKLLNDGLLGLIERGLGDAK